jgi:macrolide-specific efflux system membrane fusion protein
MVLARRRPRGLSAVNVILVAVVLVIAVATYLIFFRSEPQAAATRPSVQVARGEVTSTVSSSGTLESSQTAAPQFATSGTVTAVLVKVGQVVAKNAPLARIDAAPAERELRIAEQNQIAAANSVTAAEETLADAEEAEEAAEEADENATSETGQSTTTGQTGGTVSVTSATASLARARADKEQADQAVESAEEAVAATTLRAPIAGTVIAVNGEVGSVAGGSSGQSSSGTSSGTTSGSTSSTAASGGFVDLANLTNLQVVASFPEADALKIKAKQAATVTLNADPDTSLTATLTSVSPTPVTQNGVVSYSATFTFTKKPSSARIGQTANVSVVTAKVANALYVPTTAITTSGSTHTVTLADGGGIREVQIGVRGDSFTQITSGLTESDRVELIQGTLGGATGPGTGRPGQLGQQGGQPGQFPGAGTNNGR